VKKNTIEWLLEKDNPSVSYLTLTDLLEYPHDHPDVRESYRAINNGPNVVKILSKQNPKGYWKSAEYPYHPK
jgi:hypothetical protein